MNRIFIDTDVIIDFLADREPFSSQAAILFQFALEKKIEVFIAAISINNTYYILRQVTSHKRALRLISQLTELVTIHATDSKILQEALKSDFADFEDAIQYHSAEQIEGIEVIVTRNTRDFRKSEIPVLSPETTVKLLLNK